MANLLQDARAFLEPQETVQATIAGQYEKPKPGGGKEHIRACILLATDRRVVFYAKKVTGHDFETFAYALITSIAQGKNLMGHNVHLTAAGASVDVKWIKDAGALALFVEVVRGHMTEARKSTSLESSDSASSVNSGDPIEQLRRLGELRDAGIISAEEFETKKVELMGRI